MTRVCQTDGMMAGRGHPRIFVEIRSDGSPEKTSCKPGCTGEHYRSTSQEQRHHSGSYGTMNCRTSEASQGHLRSSTNDAQVSYPTTPTSRPCDTGYREEEPMQAVAKYAERVLREEKRKHGEDCRRQQRAARELREAQSQARRVAERELREAQHQQQVDAQKDARVIQRAQRELDKVAQDAERISRREAREAQEDAAYERNARRRRARLSDQQDDESGGGGFCSGLCCCGGSKKKSRGHERIDDSGDDSEEDEDTPPRYSRTETRTKTGTRSRSRSRDC